MVTEKVFGVIYMIKNKVNNKIYIGQTIRDYRKRISEHKTDYLSKSHSNKYLSNTFNKYGWDNFEFSVIDTANNIDELNEKEINYILQYNSTNKDLGYNIELGGKNSQPSPETLAKMSLSHLGIKQSKEWIDKKIHKAGSEEAKKYGKPKTDEDKVYLSVNSPKFWKGKSRDQETKDKISKTKIERGWSDKQKNVCKKVYKINKTTNEVISVFETTALAGIDANVNQSTISRWCMNNKTINNILWSYEK